MPDFKNLKPINNHAILNIIGNVMDQLDKNFKLNQKNKIYVEYGENLIKTNKTMYNKALNLSLNRLHKSFHLTFDKEHKKLHENVSYIIIYQPDNKNKKDLLKFIIPFGANLIQILSGLFVEKPSKQDKSAKTKVQYEKETKKYLDNLTSNFLQNLAINQLLQYYEPHSKFIRNIPQDILNTLKFNSVPKDSFNCAINIRLPLRDLYKPLQKVIKENAPKNQYDQAAPTPIAWINSDNRNKPNKKGKRSNNDKNIFVNIVSTLY